MAGKIKGITIEIAGETKGLDKALTEVNKKSRDLQGELKKVESGLKFNPGNTELIAQKQALLADAVINTTKKLDSLKQAQAEVEAKFKSGEISDTQYRDFRRELIKTEGQLKDLQSAAKDVNVKATVIADTKGVDKVKSALKELGPAAKAAGKEMADGLKSGGAAGAAAVGAIVVGSNDLNRDLARLQTNAEIAGRDLGFVEQAFKDIAIVSGETDSAVETISNLLASGFSDNQLESVIEGINGATVKFSDTLKSEGIADGIQETFATGKAMGMFGELLERSGMDLDKFNDSLAVAKQFGSETDFVLQTMAELGLSDVTDKYKELNPELVESNEATLEMQTSLADLAIVLTPLVTSVTDFLTKIVEWAEENPELATTLATVAGVITVITGALMILAPIMTVITALALALGVSVGTLMLPILLAIAAIGLLVAAGVLLYKNWDVIKERAALLKEFVVNKMSELKEKGLENFEKLKDGISNIIDKIKGFFSSLKLKLPKISVPKLPTFSLKGEFSLKPPSVPKLGINWNADGGVFNKPTIFNTSAGLQGVGEAGSEAILPLNSKVLGDIGKGIAETMGKNSNSNLISGNTFVVREEADINKIARQLFQLQQKSSRGAFNS